MISRKVGSGYNVGHGKEPRQPKNTPFNDLLACIIQRQCGQCYTPTADDICDDGDRDGSAELKFMLYITGFGMALASQSRFFPMWDGQ